MTLEEKLQERYNELNRKQAENDLLRRNAEINTKAIIDLGHQLEIGQEALQFLENVANSRRGTLKQKIESIITQALRLIYGPNYSVELIYNVKNNRSSLDIETLKETPEGQIRRGMNGIGGGVSDCISVPLRLLVLLGSKQTDKVCVLDECFKHVNPERVEIVSEFIREIAKKLDTQIIMLSHHATMREEADKIYFLEDDQGKSIVNTQLT